MENMLREDQAVREWAQPLGLHVEPLTHKEFLAWQVQPARVGGMAAFRVRSLSGGFFYGAVQVLEEAPAETPVGTYDRLRGSIQQAMSQFESLNPSRTVPNVMIWLNQEKRRSPDDLLAVLSEFVEMGEWGLDSGLLRFSWSRILNLQYNLNAHVWLDGTENSGKPNYHLVQDHRHFDHFDLLCRWFQLAGPISERNL